MDDREQRIRERAYSIWESEGRREGSHAEHWHRASQDVDGSSVEEVNEEASERFNGEESRKLSDENIALGAATSSPD